MSDSPKANAETVARVVAGCGAVQQGEDAELGYSDTCTISGKIGVLPVWAKAHGHELTEGDKCGAAGANRISIEQALREANTGLRTLTRGAWQLSSEHHYQLSNRFAWSWKIASLGAACGAGLSIYLKRARNGAPQPPLFRKRGPDTERGHSGRRQRRDFCAPVRSC